MGSWAGESPVVTFPTKYCTYWKLVRGNGTENGVHYSAQFEHQDRDGTFHTYLTRDGTMKVNEQFSFPDVHWWFYKQTEQEWRQWTDANGTNCVKVKLTVLIPYATGLASLPERFSMRFSAKNKSNLVAALNDSSSSDLTIVTSDKKELHVHKFVLNDKCPVFASMFSSQFAENTTGIVNVKDISGKTMWILLHFFYTGELLKTWCDPDTIVEFTYAAGKYQMDQVLEMLDDFLGTTDKEETSEFDVQLMSMANKLGLINAEARLVKRVKKITSQFDSAEQFIRLFGSVKVSDSDDENLLVRASRE